MYNICKCGFVQKGRNYSLVQLISFLCLITGKHDELQQLLGEMTAVNLMSLMGDNGAQQRQRQKERQQKREERKAQGISGEEIAKLEAEEDAQVEQEALQKSTGNTLQDLEVCNFVNASCHCQSVEKAVPA